MPYDGASLTRRIAEGDRDDSDSRREFARDRDRILYSTAFRRMAGKTQVVGVDEYGLYHTRLTHSLKVAQLGRRLAERLRESFMSANVALNLEIWPPDPDLVEAACLAHDLGHPPFGHVGEEVLQERFDELARGPKKRKTSFRVKRLGGFEGNAQTFRLLAYLSAREPLQGRPGLNLTRAALDAASKYPWPRVHHWQEQRKWGVIDMDLGRLEWVRGSQGTNPRGRLSFEAQLMDWCDDVTYAVHDVVDFYRAGAIPLDELLGVEGPPGQRRPRPAAVDFLDMVESEIDEPREVIDDAWALLAAGGLAELPGGWTPTLANRAATQALTSDIITLLVDDVGWDGEAPCLHEGDLIKDSSEERSRLKELACELLKKLLWKYVIERPALASQRHGQSVIVRGLLDIFSGDADLLPEDRLEDLKDHGDLLRAATDHVALLTEQDAQALYHRLTGVRLGSLTDQLL